MADAINATLQWTFGLKGSNGKYFSVETFGDQMSVSGAFMRKKQIFTLEQEEGSSVAFLKTPTNKYLSATAKGALSATENKGKDEEWTILPQKDGSWAIQSAHKNYLSGSDNHIHADGRDIGANEKWIVHLAMHPQVVMRNIGRKAYMHLEDGDANINELIPWGADALVTMEFHDGLYALRMENNKYVTKSGTLAAAPGPDSKFVIEFAEGQVAFKDNDGKYLQGVGPKGKVQSKRDQVGKNELFLLEDSHPQVTLKSSAGKLCSIKQGLDVKANASDSDVTDTELFQMEIRGNKWAFRNHKGDYWTVEGGIINSSAKSVGDNELFEVEFHGPQITLKNGSKYVGHKPNGALYVAHDSPDDTCKFFFNIQNRPQLVLRGEYGFCATKSSKQVSGANPNFEVYTMEVKDGEYYIKGPDGYWAVGADGTISANSATPEAFYLEMPVYTKWHIKSSKNGKYLKGEHQGNFTASADSTGKETLWEY